MFRTDNIVPCSTTLFQIANHCYNAQHCSILHSNVPYCTSLFHTAHHCSILHSTAPNCTHSLNCATYGTTLYCSAQHCSILNKVVPYCTTLIVTSQHCSILHKILHILNNIVSTAQSKKYYCSILHKNVLYWQHCSCSTTAKHCYTAQNCSILLINVPYCTSQLQTSEHFSYCATQFHMAQRCSILHNTDCYFTTLFHTAQHTAHPTEQSCTIMHTSTETTIFSLCCDSDYFAKLCIIILIIKTTIVR